jgi:hypothetical protein
MHDVPGGGLLDVCADAGDGKSLVNKFHFCRVVLHVEVNSNSKEDPSMTREHNSLSMSPIRVRRILKSGLCTTFSTKSVFGQTVHTQRFVFAFMAPARQFCLPASPPAGDKSSEPQIIVPSALRMGCKHSPPFFCAASQTGRNLGKHLPHQAIGLHGSKALQQLIPSIWFPPPLLLACQTKTPSPSKSSVPAMASGQRWCLGNTKGDPWLNF